MPDGVVERLPFKVRCVAGFVTVCDIFINSVTDGRCSATVAAAPPTRGY